MSMKAFPQGWVTWASKKNYVQIELDPNALPNYATGKPYQYDNQWMLGATEAENGFTLTNRGKPYSYLVWVNAEIGSGNHVAVYDDPDSRKHMSEGGDWRKDASWIIHSTNEDNYYKLENLAKNGSFLTWTYAKYNDFNYFIQLAYDAAEDSKFSFEPSGIRLEARVYDFEFEESLDEILYNGKSQNSLVAKKRFPNHSDAEITSTLDESIQIKDSVVIGFKESLSMMYKTTMSVTMLVATGGSEFSFEGGFEANQEKHTEISKTMSLKTEIKIPPHKDIEASIYTVWANNVELPFTAKMKVVGRAERIVINHPEEIREGYIPPDVVEDFVNSSGNNMEVISRSGDNLIVKVSGVLKGNIGAKTIVSTKEVGK